MARDKISFTPSIRRLPSYLSIIKVAHEAGDEYISGTVIAFELNLEPIQVRKDLAITGIVGKPKRGYPVVALIEAIERFLGWHRRVEAVLIGAGNLGSALTGFPMFREHGLMVLAAFDSDPAKLGRSIRGTPVFGMDSLDAFLGDRAIDCAILTVSPGSAQAVADRLVSSGIRAIWNFTNVKLKLPPRVVVQNEDLSSGYAMLSVRMRHASERLDLP